MSRPRSRTPFALAAVLTLALSAAVVVGQSASAHRGDDDKQDFRGTLGSLNGSGVTGKVRVVDSGGELRVKMHARGLEGGQMHMAHIHGRGAEDQATCPTMALAGPDGILSVGEGVPAYGPVVVTIAHDPVKKGRLRFDRDFFRTDAGGSIESMGSLGRYVVVVHGLTAADDGNPDNGIAAGYQPALPVACAVLTLH